MEPIFVQLPNDKDPFLLWAFAHTVMPLTQVFLAIFALKGGQVEIVLAVRAHVGIVLFVEGNYSHIFKLAVLVNGAFDEDVLPVEDSLVLLHDLSY